MGPSAGNSVKMVIREGYHCEGLATFTVPQRACKQVRLQHMWLPWTQAAAKEGAPPQHRLRMLAGCSAECPKPDASDADPAFTAK